DWFDIHATVRIGDHTLPFVLLAKTIPNQQHFHPLEHGHCLLVPASRLADYKHHFLLGAVTGDHLRTTKAQALALRRQAHDNAEQPSTAIQMESLPPPSDLKAILRPYQLIGFQWLAAVQAAGLGACLADDMGLGKTLQTIAMLLHMQGNTTGEQIPEQKLQ